MDFPYPQNAQEANAQAQEIKAALHTGNLSYEQAVKMLAVPIKVMQERMDELAEQYKMPKRKISVPAFLR